MSYRFQRAALVAAVLFIGATPLVPPTTRDGSNDFNFLIGKWHAHTRILKKLFVHSHDWEDCMGTENVQAFSNGGGDFDVGPITCGKTILIGMTVRLYDPSTHQWSLYWATATRGLSGPPQVGHFYSNGVGIFDTYYSYRGIPTIARYRWRLLSGNHPYFQQLYSNDNGKTWELNWTTVYTKA
jgi:hypothetical protein